MSIIQKAYDLGENADNLIYRGHGVVRNTNVCLKVGCLVLAVIGAWFSESMFEPVVKYVFHACVVLALYFVYDIITTIISNREEEASEQKHRRKTREIQQQIQLTQLRNEQKKLKNGDECRIL
jgi:amino acid permease